MLRRAFAASEGGGKKRLVIIFSYYGAIRKKAPALAVGTEPLGRDLGIGGRKSSRHRLAAPQVLIPAYTRWKH